MDVVFVLARLVAGWLIGLTGSGQEGFFAMAAGMRSWFVGGDDTEGRSGVLVFIKKRMVFVLMTMNGVLALMIGFTISYIQHHSVQPVLSHIPSPTPSPTPTSDSSSCTPVVESTPTS